MTTTPDEREVVSPSTYWYASRRLPQPVEATAAALDRLTGNGIVPCELARASLGATPMRAGAPLSRGPARRLRGRLRLPGVGGWGGPVPVEVELQAWSRRESEVGVRPAGPRPPIWRADRYFASAAALLDDLSQALLVTVDEADEVDALLRAS